MMLNRPKTVTEYIFSKPVEVQIKLEELRSYLKEVLLDASEELKWGKPAFISDGILLVYAGFTNHISLHPTPSVIDAFRKHLVTFKLSENTVQFPIARSIPKATVMDMAKLRLYEKNEKGIGWK